MSSDDAEKPGWLIGKMASRIARLTLMLLAAAIVFALVARAALNFDVNWDALAYHDPFAARLAGMCDIDCFEMTWGLELYFRSFPIVIEFIQGWLWRLTGVPEATNLVSIAALLTLISYLVFHWKVRWYWAVIGLTAIPFVQIFATSTYIDMTTNALATIGLLTVAELIVRPKEVRPPVQVLFVLAMALLGNSKLQMMPVALAVTVAFIALMTITAPQRGDRFFDLRRPLPGLLLSLAVLMLVNATALRNLVAFGNPYYPVQITLFGHVLLPGDLPDMGGYWGPVYLANAPQPLRWLVSVLEIRAFDQRALPYILGQGGVPPDAPSLRIGGYFATYILISLGFLAIGLRHLKKAGVLLGGYFLSLTVATSFMPASEEVRYYMFWGMTLVSLVLILYVSPGYGAPASDRLQLVWRWVMLSCFVAVTAMTGASYLAVGSFNGASAFFAQRDIEAGVRAIKDGQTVCVIDLRYGILYSQAYHPDRHFKIIQGDNPACDTRL